MSYASPNSHAAVGRELPLQEALEFFSDPELVRRWHEAKARAVYYTGPQRIWATGEIHQVKPRDPAAEAAQRTAWGALLAAFRGRLSSTELEATGIPHPSRDGGRTRIPAELWSVLRIDWRRSLVWDGLGQKPAQGDLVWRDVRVQQHQPRVKANHEQDGPTGELTELRSTMGIAAVDTAPDDSRARAPLKLEACIKSRLDRGDRPGDTIDWKTFRDLVRDESNGWTTDTKSLNRKKPRFRFGDRWIERIVARLRKE